MTDTIATGDWLTDPRVQAVFDALEAAGHPAWCVGGCVRNALIGAPVADVDVSTPARPDQVTAAAEAAGLKPVPTGIEHGTITVVSDGHPVEVTTFRRDVETDGRRAVVAFADRMEDDALRRDFTMNALYADRHGVVTDPLGEGVRDLAARHVRFIARAEDRIREDYLRILRFFRFHAWYGDTAGGLDPDGVAACAALKDGLAGLSRERVGAEVKKLLSAPAPQATLDAMHRAGVLDAVLHGADPAGLPALIALEAEAGVAPDWPRRLSLLAKGETRDALRLSRAEARQMSDIALARAMVDRPAMAGYRRGAEAARDALLIEAARRAAPLSGAALAAAAHGAAQVFPVRAADLADVIPPGPALGAALKRLEDHWLSQEFAPDRADLLAMARDGG